MKYKSIIFLLVLFVSMSSFVYSLGNTESIYQEDANLSNCETYPFGNESYCYNMTDGDWDTNIRLSIMDPDSYPPGPLITEMTLYLDYEKPTGALSSSKWQLKGGSHPDYGTPAYVNYSMSDFPECWNQDTLKFRVYIFDWWGHGGEITKFYCYGGNDWIHMNEDWGDPMSSEAVFYEEAMSWEVGVEAVDKIKQPFFSSFF
ncbi:hypothetical protein HOG16_02500 [Candidatus Woesearchaeota archaeon]|jgi:hypothetical protein|nr:hypothetical protein [Candidatus Woesearchaeota archaeon]MBT4321967.1 hypothetical protein [Candidatus Woesearchaeota archaeon]MBT4631319.1 hypothetical protein [Candidatus Woesearchaeota archaeon]